MTNAEKTRIAASTYWLIPLALFCLVAALSLLPGVRELNQRISDSYFRLQPGHTSSDVVVIAIDDASLQNVGRWPWPREKLAQLLNAVAASGSRVIGIDILLSEPQSADQDAALRDALQSAGNVVLVDKIANFPDGPRWVEPLPSFAKVATAIGHAQAVLDADGVCRSFPPEELSLDGPRLAFAIEVARRADLAATDHLLTQYEVGANDASGIVTAKPTLIPIAFRRDAVPAVSAAELLTHKTDDRLRGKVVLIGFAAVEIADRMQTPISRSLPTPGVEIHAQIVDAILKGRALHPLSWKLSALLLLLVALSSAQLFRWIRGWKAVPVTILSAAALYVAGYLAFRLASCTAPTGTFIGCILLAPLMIYGVELAVLERGITRQMRQVQQWLMSRPSVAVTRGDLPWRMQLLTDLQRELGFQYELYRVLLEATHDLVAVFDGGGKLLFANSAFATALHDKMPTTLPEIRRLLRESNEAPLKATTGMVEGEATLGDQLYSVRLLPLPATSISPTGGTFLSMTSLHLRVERDRAREEALAFVTHELRTPLVAIQGFAELMSRMPSAPAAAHAPDTILRESKRLLALINGYLDVLRTDAGARPLRIENFELQTMIGEVLELLAPVAEASSIQLVCDCDSRIVMQADRPLLAGAVLNLVGNAIKYGKAGCEVRVTAAVVGEGLQLAVHNVGDPIATDKNLFAPFVRGAATGNEQPGWGLGLSLVKRIAEKHSGSITVKSDTDSGTTFLLCIPCAHVVAGVSAS